MPKQLPVEYLRSILSYDPASGDLKWLVTRNSRVVSNMKAGSFAKNGYVVMTIDYGQYLAHRVGWALAHGSWPCGDIDHINGNRSDNRLSNLRDVPRSSNLQNQRRAHRDSASGLLGVRARRDGRFTATIMRNYKAYYLGTFSTPEEASAAYQAAKLRIHNQPPAEFLGKRGVPR